MKKRLLAALVSALAAFVPLNAWSAPIKCLAVQVNEGDAPPSVPVLRTLLPNGGCVRDMLGWHQVEKVAGQYTMPDRQWQSYGNVASAGAFNLITLGFGNKLYGSNGYQPKLNNFGLPVTPAQIQAFTKYAVWAVRKDGTGRPNATAANIPNLYAVSIWNELNGAWDGGIDDIHTRIAAYAALVNAVGPAIRQANPKVKIIIGATVGSNIDGWYQRLLVDGTWGRNDPNVYLDVHPYIGRALSPTNQYVPQLDTWNRSMLHIRKAGIKNALFATEWGGPLAKFVEGNNPGLNYIDWSQKNIFATEAFAGAAWFALTSFGDSKEANLIAASTPSLQVTKLGSEFVNW